MDFLMTLIDFSLNELSVIKPDLCPVWDMLYFQLVSDELLEIYSNFTLVFEDDNFIQI